MRKVLIIDDEPDIREVASISLQAIAGWQVFTAPSGPAGIETALTSPPDAILLDVMMPELDGPSTFRAMREKPELAHVPVILITAKVRGIDQRRFQGLGVAGVLFKPFDPLTLAHQMSAALGWS
jgi:CheY-like chemotaxis protein